MGGDHQERAVTPENMGAEAWPEMNTQIEGKKVPVHGTGILFMENKIINMNGICFKLIWFFVFDFIAPCLSEYVTFLFDN